MTLSRTDFDAAKRALDDIDETCARERRDVSPAEQATYNENIKVMEAYTRTAERGRAHDAVAAVNRRLVSDGVGVRDERGRMTPYEESARPSLVREVGEFAHERSRAMLGKLGVQRYAAEANELGRVVAHGVSGDGTAPVTIEGDVIAFVDANRYAVNASHRLPMPDNRAPSFKRPRISQFTTDAQQVTEGDILSSQRLQLTGDTVTKTTRGGVLALSEQELDWTDPAMLGQAILDLARQYAITTDTVLTAAITAAAADSTETILANTGATLAQVITAISAASLVVYQNAKVPADVLFVDPIWWAQLAALSDTTGRPAFPIAGPFDVAGKNDAGVSSFGGFNIMGLKVVVDPNFAGQTMIAAASQYVEFYEQDKGLLSVNVPSTLEVQYAYRGYVAANVYAQGLALVESA
jgi:hypothetical protein